MGVCCQRLPVDLFSEQEFSIDEFRATFPTSQAQEVIHDLWQAKVMWRRWGEESIRLSSPRP